MVSILQPFVTPGGDVLSYPRANVVVVTDIASNVQRLRDLAATFDVDAFRNQQVRVFQGDARRSGGAGERDPRHPLPLRGGGTDGGDVFMVPLNRLNALVVFAIDPMTFTEGRALAEDARHPAGRGGGGGRRSSTTSRTRRRSTWPTC
jgi:type II secretory pathway component GspD/PulD (secretin)